MRYTLKSLNQLLQDSPEQIEFSSVIALIDEKYSFVETGFDNGGQRNEAGQNSGSCKVLSFAQINNYSEQQALALFGQYYRNDVLANPSGNDHQNIRQFMRSGYEGLRFDAQALVNN